MNLSKGIDFIVDWPPSINNYYAKTRYGVRVNKKGKNYRESVVYDLQVQVGVIDCINEPIFVSAIFYPPDKRIRDLDNFLKSLLDALTVAGLWEDDNLISQLYIYKGEVTKRAIVKVHVAEAMPIVSIELEPTDLI